MRYPHMVNVYESLGWTVEETDTGIAVMAGPVDPESKTGYIRIDTEVGPMDDRKEKLTQCARELADQMLLATWSVVCNEAKPEEKEEELDEESKSILPFATPTAPIGV